VLENRLEELRKDVPTVSLDDIQSQDCTLQKSPPMSSADSPTSESAAFEEELSDSLSRLVLDQATGTSSSHLDYTLGTEQKDDQYGYGCQAKASLTNLRRPEFCSVYPVSNLFRV